jgi:hypothetical protein
VILSEKTALPRCLSNSTELSDITSATPECRSAYFTGPIIKVGGARRSAQPEAAAEEARLRYHRRLATFQEVASFFDRPAEI